MSNTARSPEEEALWDYVRNLQKQVDQLRRELDQHYSNHAVAHNVSLDQARLDSY